LRSAKERENVGAFASTIKARNGKRRTSARTKKAEESLQRSGEQFGVVLVLIRHHQSPRKPKPSPTQPTCGLGFGPGSRAHHGLPN
jgi:hypothetical protein